MNKEIKNLITNLNKEKYVSGYSKYTKEIKQAIAQLKTKKNK